MSPSPVERAEHREPARTPAGPRGGLVFGSLPDLARDPLGLLVRSRAEFGDVVRFRYFGPFAWFLFAHPEHVDQILVAHHQNFPLGVFGRLLDLVIPNGLVSADDAVWARQRRLVQPAFHPAAIAGLADTIVGLTVEHLERWVESGRGGRALDATRLMRRLSFDIGGRTLLGDDMLDAMDVIDNFVERALRRLDYRLRRPLSPLPFLPTPDALRYRRAARRADRALSKIVAHRRARPRESSDLLSMLLSSVDDDGRLMNDDDVRDQAKTLLISSYETSGTLLGWLCYCLAERPAIEARVREEIRSVVGDRLPHVDDLPRLTYTKQVVEETLRLYPPVPWLGRQARRECTIGGYRVPARSVICLSAYVTHRHPSYWDEPDTFDPDRFAPDAVKARPKGAYYPFGLGPRYCVGHGLAMMEALLVTAVVLPRWRFRLQPGAVVEPQLTATLRPRNGAFTLEPAP